MEISGLEDILSEYSNKSDEAKRAYVDDFNSESATVIISFGEYSNLRKLSWEIKRLFKKCFDETVNTSLEYESNFGEKILVHNYYEIDFPYAYREANIEALKNVIK